MPPSGVVTITGVNVNLSGVDNSTDFWPGISLKEAHPGGTSTHQVTDGQTPEPATLAVLGLGLCVAWRRWRPEQLIKPA
jgi:hypothetical protein